MATLNSCNPATGESVGEVPVTAVPEIPAVVARARAAFPAWRDLGLEGRRLALLPAGAQLLERVDELGRLLTAEMGKPLADATGEVRYPAESFAKSLDEIAAALQPEVFDEAEHVRSEVHFEPHGVCVAISPWNFPLMMPHWLVLPALLAGNTVVFKPSEETPLIAQAYAEILQANLPADVLQIVHGADDQGKTLVASDVDMIAFTGSREAGKHILREASSELKRVVLELGGKDPMLVLEDADVEAAAAFAAKNSFRNAGQVCVSTERIYVHESIADSFESELSRLVGEIRVGPGTEEGVTVGPMINARQKAHVVAQVEAAIAAGAKVAAGGEGHHDNFFMPTVLTEVNHDMAIMRDETFGPVACVQRFSEVDEAVRLANDTVFGLGAVVFGKDQALAAGVARRIQAGMIGVNRGCGGTAGTPWVGVKQSGYGFHSGREGHRQFAMRRIVTVSKTS